MYPEVTQGPRTTADSLAEGRLKVSVDGRKTRGIRDKKRKVLLDHIKSVSSK